jgi:alpha-L-rhamnosidase
MNSFAHYSFGAVYQWIVENAGGIRMADVAYGKLRIEPRPGGGLTWANTRYDSVRGPIATSWRIAGDRFALDVEIPPNVDATVTVPTSDSSSVRVDGRPPSEAGLEVVAEAPGAITFAVPSGDWSFAALR